MTNAPLLLQKRKVTRACYKRGQANLKKRRTVLPLSLESNSCLANESLSQLRVLIFLPV